MDKLNFVELSYQNDLNAMRILIKKFSCELKIYKKSIQENNWVGTLNRQLDTWVHILTYGLMSEICGYMHKYHSPVNF